MCNAIVQLFTVLGWASFGFALMYALDEQMGFCLFFTILGALFWFTSQ